MKNVIWWILLCLAVRPKTCCPCTHMGQDVLDESLCNLYTLQIQYVRHESHNKMNTSTSRYALLISLMIYVPFTKRKWTLTHRHPRFREGFMKFETIYHRDFSNIFYIQCQSNQSYWHSKLKKANAAGWILIFNTDPGLRLLWICTKAFVCGHIDFHLPGLITLGDGHGGRLPLRTITAVPHAFL